MSAHPSPGQLADWLKDKLPPAATQQIVEHLEECDGVCAAVLEGISPQEELGPYRLLSLLGGGGMGKVYKAVHQHLGKVVALKVLAPQRLTDPRAIVRFRKEMKAVGVLNHPHIVQAYDAGQVGRVHFLAMEYLEGVDLARLVRRRGRLSPANACEAIRQAAKGLQHAHENGLVHRDLKPSNLMLTRAGVVKILDLGLARIAANEGDPAHTRLGHAMGTADYAAPEQLVDSHSVDIRADLYSLGCTLFHLLVGQPPFSGDAYPDRQSTFLGHLRSEPPALETLRPDVPAAVAAIMGKLLAKRAEDRFPTPKHLAAGLKPFCAGASLAGLLSTKVVAADTVKTLPSAPSPFSAATLGQRSVPSLKAGEIGSGHGAPPETVVEPLIAPRTGARTTEAGARTPASAKRPWSPKKRLVWAAVPVAVCIPLIAWLAWHGGQGTDRDTDVSTPTKPAKPGKTHATASAGKNPSSTPAKLLEENPGNKESATPKSAKPAAEPLEKIPATDPDSLRLVGNWRFTGMERGRSVAIIYQLRADGSCTCIARTVKVGTWRHADGHLHQSFPSEAGAKAKVDAVDGNSFVLLAIADDSAADAPLQRRFVRLTDSEYRCALGVSYMRQSPADPEAALKELNEAVRLNDSSVETYNERGHVRHALKDFAGAIADYTKGIELSPNNARLYVNRASIHLTKPMPDLKSAESDLERAIHIDGALPEAYNFRGNLWFARKDFVRAIADYSQAIKLNQNNPVFFNNRGNTYLACGKVELGNNDLARAKELGGTFPNPPAVPMTELSIRNKTTENVFVAVAYKQPRGDVAVQAWHTLTPEQVKVFRAEEAADMYLRVERPGGREVTFTRYTTFQTWPASSDRFTVSRQPDDDSVWVLRSGPELKNSHTVEKSSLLPAGWTQRRFFRAGAGSGVIEVVP
jgi:serine/threonine protein kinase/tetratricopeptide (TPR) repeat protein